MSAHVPTLARLQERGRALYALEDAGCSVTRLVRLDRQVRRGRSDWPGRPPGVPEYRGGAPPEWLVRREEGRP